MMKKRTPVQRSQAGMMLLEVLVSVLIFSFGILGTVALHARATQFSTNAEDRNRAALLANEIASMMWTSGTVSLPATDTDAWKARVSDPRTVGLPTGVGDVAVAGGVATITVTWTPSFGGGSNRFVTQVAM